MFGHHVTEQMSAYAHGELAESEGRRVAAHLRACEACRREFDEIKLGIRLAETLPVVGAPATLWDRLETQLLKQPATDRQPVTQRATLRGRIASLFSWRDGSWQPRALVASLLLVLFAGASAWWFSARQGRAAWEVARLEGAPRIDASAFGERGRLGVGEWLETDAHSRASIKVANIGRVEVAPETRIRLVETRQTEHRLELQRGRMSAVIYAPPRLFFVNTPSAVAADLGCAYTLEVDDAGRSILHVTSGWVALETRVRDAIVPAGAACLTKPGEEAGTPFFEDAPDALRASLMRFDFEDGGAEALRVVLDAARPRDTLTLWHLLSRVEGQERTTVYERLAALAPPPAGVTREGVLALNPSMLDAWKEHLETSWRAGATPYVSEGWSISGNNY